MFIEDESGIMVEKENLSGAEVPRMISLRKAAEKTGLTYLLIRELCDSGKVAYLKSGRKYLVNYQSLLALLKNGEGRRNINDS